MYLCASASFFPAPPTHLWNNFPPALTPARSGWEFNGSAGSVCMCFIICLWACRRAIPFHIILQVSLPVFRPYPACTCVGCATHVQEKVITTSVAAMINGGNWFHSDNSRQTKKKAILLVALFCTIDPKDNKIKKIASSQFLCFDYITVHTGTRTFRFRSMWTHWFWENTPTLHCRSLAADTFLFQADWSGHSAFGIPTYVSVVISYRRRHNW